MKCTEWVDRRPCDQDATMRLTFEALIQEGHTVTTARCYCEKHGQLVIARFQQSKQPHTKETL